MRLGHNVVPCLLISFVVLFFVLKHLAPVIDTDRDSLQAITESLMERPELEMKINPASVDSVKSLEDKDIKTEPCKSDVMQEKKGERFTGKERDDIEQDNEEDAKKNMLLDLKREENKEKSVDDRQEMNLGQKKEEVHEPSTERKLVTKKELPMRGKMTPNRTKYIANSKNLQERMGNTETYRKTVRIIQQTGNQTGSKLSPIDRESQIKSLHLESTMDEKVKQRLIAYRKAMEYEQHLKETKNAFADITKLAKRILQENQASKIISLCFVSSINIQFLNNWLCNTKDLDLGSSLLIVTSDKQTKAVVDTNWPDIKTFALESKLSGTVLKNSTTSLRKMSVINALLHAGINLLLFDVESVWLENPITRLEPEAAKGYDILVNKLPMSHINTGFLLLFATEKTRSFWTTLYGRLRLMEKPVYKIGRNITEPEPETDYEHLLLSMILNRSKGVHVLELPISSYTEGIWYLLSKEEQRKTNPIVIRNNFIRGNDKKIQRARLWNHWFLKEDDTCNTELVRKVVRV